MPKAKARKGRKTDNEALTKKVLALRDKNKKWSDIGEQLGITPGKAQFLVMCSEVKPKDKIKFSDDEELAEKVVEARDEQLLSWGLIAARTGVSEGKIKRLYDEAGGKGPQNVASARKGDDETTTRKPRKAGRKAAKAKAATSKRDAVARKGRGKRKGKGRKGRKDPSTTN